MQHCKNVPLKHSSVQISFFFISIRSNFIIIFSFLHISYFILLFVSCYFLKSKQIFIIHPTEFFCKIFNDRRRYTFHNDSFNNKQEEKIPKYSPYKTIDFSQIRWITVLTILTHKISHTWYESFNAVAVTRLWPRVKEKWPQIFQ